MIQEITDGIVEAVHTEFGDCYAIYPEKVEQGLEEPCFFVRCILPDLSPGLFRRKRFTGVFVVQFLPKEDGTENAQMAEVYPRLADCLQIIVSGGKKIRCSSMDADSSDGILQIRATYLFFLTDLAEETDIIREVEAYRTAAESAKE